MEVVLVIFALYAIECCLWVTNHQAAFVGASKGRYRAHLGPLVPITADAGVVVCAPWNPFAVALVCDAAGRRFDVAAIEARWSQWRREIRLLSGLCGAAWFYVLVATPSVIVWRGLTASWPLLVLGWLGLMVGIAVEFAAVSRALYPGGDRLSGLVAIVLSPFSAIRACAALSRRLVADEHPVAVAHAMCRDETFAALARRFYFDADRRAARGELDEFLRSIGRLGDVVHPPDAETADMRSYCPRCHAQYSKSSGACADCLDVGLEPLSARPI